MQPLMRPSEHTPDTLTGEVGGLAAAITAGQTLVTLTLRASVLAVPAEDCEAMADLLREAAARARGG